MLAGPQQGALLWSLAIAAERQLPLTSALEPFARGSGRWVRKARRLESLLATGTSLPDAIDRVPGLVPLESVLAIRVGANTGLLPDALRTEARRLSTRESGLIETVTGGLVYIVALLTVFTAIISFVMYYIIPKFKKIFLDFGTELPALTIIVIETSDAIVEYFYLIVLIPVPIALACRALRAAGFGSWVTVGNLSIPNPWQARTQLPHILRGLSLAVKAGRPLDSALTTMAVEHSDAPLRKRLSQIHSDVANGISCWQSCSVNGLLRRNEAALLESAERVGNLPWALTRLADHVERGILHRLHLIAESVEPLFILLMALILGAFIVGMFMPIVKLINDLS
jgi:type II secretory pathway component PulF